ncbi:hypothetical protein OV079_12895 [Nannocystis pusilla]|uniref:Recombinase A n=1 Tax=Nannocystis pusilla TaxID=889268 RepID=A0A9X3EMH4_9BACT|nr:hypothetical protein [Nannocystis pusilla]MCY1006440.1 hypothetical protein [Nannocystis pusilla]
MSHDGRGAEGVEEEERTGDELAEGTASEATESVASPASFVTLAAPGKLIEVSGGAAGARLTTAVALVRQAQLEGETTVWIQPAGGPLFPPDLADSGVDLDALIVIHIPEDRGPAGIARAAELLLRSGGYGLCVLDLSAPPPPRADASDKLPPEIDLSPRACPFGPVLAACTAAPGRLAWPVSRACTAAASSS